MTDSKTTNPNWATEMLAKIEDTLQKTNGVVLVGTATKAWQFEHKHAGKFFKVVGASLYMARGKSWDCVDFAAIRIGTFK